ncbi:MAG: NUDIX hydrolase [Bacteroidetes bacterium]|nr:NUDIX hydrolase [Bacteroidota bacterium]
MKETVQKYYGNRLRVRACGLLVKDGAVLLVNHNGLGDGSFWAPPGGGMEFGETAKDCLEREWLEETGITVEVRDFLFICEFIGNSLHAIELFFEVAQTGGQLQLGNDPEVGAPVILSDIGFFNEEQLRAQEKNQLHGIFRLSTNPHEILGFRGYFKL